MERGGMRIAHFIIKPSKDSCCLEPDRFRVRPQVTVPIDAVNGPVTEVVVFEIDEQARMNFRTAGDLGDREMPAFPDAAEIRTYLHDLGGLSGDLTTWPGA